MPILRNDGVTIADEADQVISAAKAIAPNSDASLVLMTVIRPIMYAYGPGHVALMTMHYVDLEE